MQAPRTQPTEQARVTHAESARAFAQHSASKREEARARRSSASSTHTCWNGLTKHETKARLTGS